MPSYCSRFMVSTVTFPSRSEALLQEGNAHKELCTAAERKLSVGLPTWQRSWCCNQCEFAKLFTKKLKNIRIYVT